MTLLRLYLSEARFHYCTWLEARAERMTQGIRTYRKAQAIRHRERIYLGIDSLAPNATWRVPTVSASRRDAGQTAQ